MSLQSSTLFDEILSFAQGVPTSVLRKELLKSAQRFCRKTLVMQRDITLVTEPGISSVLPDFGTEKVSMVQVLELTVNGRIIKPTPVDNLRSRDPFYNNVQADEPRTFFSRTEGVITFYPQPLTEVSVAATVAVAPTDDYDGVPDELANLWSDAIVGGAIERICMIPGQPYTDPQRALMGRQWYMEGVSQARIYMYNSFGRSDMVTLRPFAKGHRKI